MGIHEIDPRGHWWINNRLFRSSSWNPPGLFDWWSGRRILWKRLLKIAKRIASISHVNVTTTATDYYFRQTREAFLLPSRNATYVHFHKFVCLVRYETRVRKNSSRSTGIWRSKIISIACFSCNRDTPSMERDWITFKRRWFTANIARWVGYNDPRCTVRFSASEERR